MSRGSRIYAPGLQAGMTTSAAVSLPTVPAMQPQMIHDRRSQTRSRLLVRGVRWDEVCGYRLHCGNRRHGQQRQAGVGERDRSGKARRHPASPGPGIQPSPPPRARQAYGSGEPQARTTHAFTAASPAPAHHRSAILNWSVTRPHRLAARTSPFQGGDRGSIPRGATTWGCTRRGSGKLVPFRSSGEPRTRP